MTVMDRPAATRGDGLTHLQRLEADSIHIMREVVAECENPVMMYSVGKDSAVMLRLAQKAFAPSPPPFPLLHVDTTWKFKAMYELRDRMAARNARHGAAGATRTPRLSRKGINPFDHGSAMHTDMWKTEGLKQALDKYGFDSAFGGARRDEEKSRAKERIFSFRSAKSPLGSRRTQRPELWNLYNCAQGQGREHPGVPDLQLDRAGHLAVHPPERTSRSCRALLRSERRPTVERDGTAADGRRRTHSA